MGCLLCLVHPSQEPPSLQPHGSSLTSFSSLLKCHLLREPCPGPLWKILTSHSLIRNLSCLTLRGPILAHSSGLSSVSPRDCEPHQEQGFLCLVPARVLSTQQLLEKYGFNEQTNHNSDGNEMERRALRAWHRIGAAFTSSTFHRATFAASSHIAPKPIFTECLSSSPLWFLKDELN